MVLPDHDKAGGRNACPPVSLTVCGAGESGRRRGWNRKKEGEGVGAISLEKAAMALGFGIVLAMISGFTLARVAEYRADKRLFPTFFLVLLCLYALGFAARYVVVEVLP